MGLRAGLMSKEYKRRYSDRDLFNRYIKRVIPFKKSVIRIAFFIVLSAIADIINPLLIGFCVDELARVNPNFLLAVSAAIVYIILYVFIWFLFRYTFFQCFFS